MLDYETLRLIWWALLGVLLIGFAVMDGFDLGVGILLPFVGKTDSERRIVINTVGPGLGRQPGLAHPRRRRDLRRLAAALCRRVLRLLSRDVAGAGGADPAAGRLQVPQQAAKARAGARIWDWALFVGGAVPALVFGVAFGNVLRGCPSASIRSCAQPTHSVYSTCSIPLRCCAGWCRWQCSSPRAPCSSP